MGYQMMICSAVLTQKTNATGKRMDRLPLKVPCFVNSIAHMKKHKCQNPHVNKTLQSTDFSSL